MFSTHQNYNFPLALLKCPNVMSKNLIQLKVSSNCWICEGWTQMEFRLTPIDKQQPFLHLSYEQFKPQKMLEDLKNPGEFYLFRMVPPGSVSFFYSNNSQNTFTDPSMPTILNQQPNISNEHITINVPKINYIENVESLEKILTTEDLLSMKAFPRPEPPVVEEEVRPKSPWSIPKSIFATYKYDTDEHLANCFDFDWRCSKIDKLIKSVKDKDKIYTFLQKNYRAIRETYKQFSAIGPSGNVFSIGTNVFSDIIYNCNGLLDSKYVKLSDVDLEFISTKAGNQFKTRQNPDRQLIRFQFLEIFVRLVLKNVSLIYFQFYKCDTHEEAVIKVFEDNVLPYFKKFNSNDFKWQKYWNEPCDIVLKKNLKTLKDIYAKFSGRESAPGEPKFMCMNEFIDLITKSGVIDDNFGAREIGVIFNLSMMTQIDEINKEKHFQMQFIEFLEAMARVADRVMSLSVIQSNQQAVNQTQLDLDAARTIVKLAFLYDDLSKTIQEVLDTSIQNQSSFIQQPIDYPLDRKIQDFIQRLSLQCMGEDYAYQYRRKLERLENQRIKKLEKEQQAIKSQRDKESRAQNSRTKNYIDKVYMIDRFYQRLFFISDNELIN